MYRLLIVDDECIITDGLYEFLSESDLELELYKCYSALEALSILKKIRIDIILSDVKMPEMDGIALSEKVRQIWPNCRMILLSGYKDVNYAMAAIRNNVVDYVLKTEDDARLIDAIRRAIASIQEQQKNWTASVASGGTKSWGHKLFSDLLFSSRYKSMVVTREFWEQAQLPLQQQEQVILVMGKITPSGGQVSQIRQELADVILVQNYFVQHMKEKYRIFWDYREELLVWLLQPQSHRVRMEAFAQIPGVLEEIEQFCSAREIAVHFAVSLKWESFGDVYAAYQRTRQALSCPERTGKGAILTMENTPDEPQVRAGEPFVLEDAEFRIEQLYICLLKSEKEKFFSSLSELLKPYTAAVPMNCLPAVRAYSALLNMLGKFVQERWADADSLKNELCGLYHLDRYASWPEAAGDLRILADNLFSQVQEPVGQSVGETVKALIQRDLSRNYSLIDLAEVVHMNPYYLSRYFKKVEGVNLSDYISSIKMKKAREFLQLPDVKIHEVSRMLGFDSSSYFSKCFKKEIGLSPLDYQRQQNAK